MGRIGNISSDLSRATGRGGVRSARLSKEKPKHRPARPRPGSVKTSHLAKQAVEEPLVIEKFDSVWDALDFSPQEKANLEVRSSLMIQLEILIEKSGWTQAEAAKHCGVSQPRINDLLRGKINKFSIDALINIAGAMGCRIEISLEAA